MAKYDLLKDLGTSGTGIILSASLIDWTDDVQVVAGLICQVMIMFITCYVNIHRMLRDKDKDLENGEEKKTQMNERTVKSNMARYTETFLEYLQNGNLLPEVFKEIPGFEDLFISNFIDHEIGFETEDLFTIKLEALSSVLIPAYKERLEMYQTALQKAKNPLKTYEDTGTTKYNAGERQTSSTEVPIDALPIEPTSKAKQEGYIDNTEASNRRVESGMTVNENYMVLDKLTEKVNIIMNNLLNEFNILFMKTYL